MDEDHLEYPDGTVLTVKSVGHFSDLLGDGDAHEVICTYPGHLSEEQAIAALIAAAAGRAGPSFESFLERVLVAGRAYSQSPAKRSENRGGAPARDWQADYGYSPTYLELNAIIRRELTPSMTKAEARRSALRAVRRAKPDKTITADAEALKQLMTYYLNSFL